MTTPIHNKVIDEVPYICEMMPATLSHRTLIRLTSLVGRPAVVMAAGAVDQETEISDLIQVGTRVIFERLTPAEADEVVKSVLNGVMAEGAGNVWEDAVFDRHFRGRLVHMYKVFAWALEVNYRDFFVAARLSGIIEFLKLAAGEVRSQVTTTLRSGDSVEPTKESTSETSSPSPLT